MPAGGQYIGQLPDPSTLENLTPGLTTLPGWNFNFTQITDSEQLPEARQVYFAFPEQKLQVPVRIVSVGPDRVSALFR